MSKSEEQFKAPGSYGADARKRVSLSVAAFQQLMDKAGADVGSPSDAVISRLEQRQWLALYRQLRSGRDALALQQLLEGDARLREQVPALYLSTAVKAQRYLRRQLVWQGLWAVLASPWRWWQRQRLPIEALGAPAPSDELQRLREHPLFAEEVAQAALQRNRTRARKSTARQPAGAPSSAVAPEAREAASGVAAAAATGAASATASAVATATAPAAPVARTAS